MKVSIIIDNWNYAQYLPAAIDSALCQTYSPVEVIVVDDGSTDESRSVIRSYGSSVFPVFKPNEGMASTYNAGFKYVTGDVVIILDADDVLAPDAAETVLDHFQYAGTAKVQWPLTRVDLVGDPIGGLEPNLPLGSGDLKQAAIKMGPDCYTSSPTSGNAWAKWFLDIVLPMPEAPFFRHADTYLISLAALYGRVRSVDRPLGQYRIHGQNDYAGKPVAERNRRNLELYSLRCRVLETHMRRLGITHDRTKWTATGTAYQWMRDLNDFIAAISAFVPPQGTFILVDDGQFGNTGNFGAFIEDKRALPFLENGGAYWGPPADDAIAISELLRMSDEGACAIAFAWPCFWWLDTYKEFSHFLHQNYRKYSDDRLYRLYCWDK